MALAVKGLQVNYKKVSGWTDGPKKPHVVLNSESTATIIKDAVISQLSTDIPNLQAGESISVVITAGGEI